MNMHHSGNENRDGGVQVIARAAAIMRVLEGAREGMSLGEVARAVGLARSTVQRIVNALIAEGFVASSGARSLRIGPAIAAMAAAAQTSDAASLIAPHLHAFGDEAGETVDLATLSGGSAVFIDQVPGRQRLVALSAVGARFPLHCTANGKAMLACLPAAQLDALLARSAAEHPTHPLRNKKALLRELEDVRKTHLAYDIGEHGQGICAVGTALLDRNGSPVAISIPVPAQRFGETRQALSAQLLSFRTRMARVLGA
ncbi:MAG: IclR family transcriptional regulator [Alphaproteobacteria bacterium]|nr:IclR family transcriptional regulator [Alphaproteobacteria bacterium]